MTDDQLFDSLTNSSLFDTYLVYGLIGTLIFIAVIGLIILLTTSYCCLYCYICCYRPRRHLSYELSEKLQEQENTRKISFIKNHSNDITNFSQLYDPYPHLINHNSLGTTLINPKHLNTSCTTINTLVTPVPSYSAFVQSGENPSKIRYPSEVNTPKDYRTNVNNRLETSRRSTAVNLSVSSKSDQRNSPCVNIYETVVPMTTITSSADRSTPIYETEWRYNLKQVIMNRRPSIELPSLSSPPTLMPTTHYFQQQHPYDQVLAARAKASDSMRRTKILKRLKDDAAFLY